MTKRPEQHAGTGGLSGADGVPMRMPAGDPTDYRPEPSVTGAVRGPMVPANQPAETILDQIERAKEPVSIDGRENRWWQPHTAGSELGPLPTYAEIQEKLNADPRAKEFYDQLYGTNRRLGLVNFNSRRLNAEYDKVLKRYCELMEQSPETYYPPEHRDFGIRWNAEWLAAFICYYGV